MSCIDHGTDVAKIVCAIQHPAPDWWALIGPLVGVIVSTVALLFVFFSEKHERLRDRYARHVERFDNTLAELMRSMNDFAAELRRRQAALEDYNATLSSRPQFGSRNAWRGPPERPWDTEMFGNFEVAALVGDSLERRVLASASAVVIAAMADESDAQYAGNLTALVGLLRLWRTGDLTLRKTLTDMRKMEVDALERSGASALVKDLAPLDNLDEDRPRWHRARN